MMIPVSAQHGFGSGRRGSDNTSSCFGFDNNNSNNSSYIFDEALDFENSLSAGLSNGQHALPCGNSHWTFDETLLNDEALSQNDGSIAPNYSTQSEPCHHGVKLPFGHRPSSGLGAGAPFEEGLYVCPRDLLFDPQQQPLTEEYNAFTDPVREQLTPVPAYFSPAGTSPPSNGSPVPPQTYLDECPVLGSADHRSICHVTDLGISGRKHQETLAPIRAWFDAHRSFPYPSSNELEALSKETGRSSQQVDTSLKNLRCREQDRETSNGHTSQYATPFGAFEKRLSYYGLDETVIGGTSQRNYGSHGGSYLDSATALPPPQAAIFYEHDAIQVAKTTSSFYIESPFLNATQCNENDLFHQVHPPSICFGSTCPPSASVVRPGLQNLRRKGKRLYSSFTNQGGQPHSSINELSGPVEDKRKSFFCTICTSTFKGIYEWKRHEASTHFGIEEWVCMKNTDFITNQRCIFCSHPYPDASHFGLHQVQTCLQKPFLPRTFFRKDKLKQHVQQVHLSSFNNAVKQAFKIPDSWVSKDARMLSNTQALWCGFCQNVFSSWEERVKHVAAHMQSGKTREDWITNARQTDQVGRPLH